MEPDEIEVASKSGTSVRSDKNAVIDYDEDRVRLELIVPGILNKAACCPHNNCRGIILEATMTSRVSPFEISTIT